MPKFEVVPTSEVPRPKPAGRQVTVHTEYIDYLGQIGRSKAGKLTPSVGETSQALRRRLGAAAKHVGKEIVVKRNGKDVYFWAKSGQRRKANGS